MAGLVARIERTSGSCLHESSLHQETPDFDTTFGLDLIVQATLRSTIPAQTPEVIGGCRLDSEVTAATALLTIEAISEIRARAHFGPFIGQGIPCRGQDLIIQCCVHRTHRGRTEIAVIHIGVDRFANEIHRRGRKLWQRYDLECRGIAWRLDKFVVLGNRATDDRVEPNR